MKPVLIFILFLAFTLPLMPVQWILLKLWPAAARRFPTWYHRQLTRILGFRVTVMGAVPDGGPALLVANHVSWIDVVVLSAVLPVSFVAKREVMGWPLFGSLARLQRTVFVEREKRARTGQSRNEMQERLRSGDVLVLFPEGTSSNGEGVLPFRSSYFAAADDLSVAVIPVSLAYTHVRGIPMTKRERPFFAWYGDMELMPHLLEAIRQGPVGVTISFHPPLPRADRKTRARQAETIVREGLANTLHGRFTGR